MMKIIQNLSKYELFSIAGLLILGLEFLAILLTLINFFYWPVLASYLLLGSLLFILLVFHNRATLKSPSFLFAIVISFITVSIFSYSFNPSIFSGRDQGSFSEAAIRLSQNHKLTFDITASQEFFKIYGPGLALNFPGFSYTQTGSLVTNFSLGYTAWLATFYSLFGLYGLGIANSITFLLFLLSFYLLTELYASPKSAFLSLFLVISSFVFPWILKFTLSENLAMGLIWYGILELSLFSKLKKSSYFLSALSSFLILAFTRIEAWTLIAMLIIAFFIIQKNNKAILKKEVLKKISWIIGGFLLIYILNIWTNNQFYLASLKGLLRSFSPTENSSAPFSIASYIWKIFSFYNILPFLFISAIGIIHFLVRKKYDLLLPILIILPTLSYLIHPGISLDHPWMLRRFTFTIIPCAIFYSALIINQLFTKKILFYILGLILISSNLLVTMPYFKFRENKSLLDQTQSLSENFSATDLVLVDRLSSGDAWSMLSGPLSFFYNKQAVYFFNPKDLAKIDTTKFSNVYLIIPNENLAFYEKDNFLNQFSPQKDYAIQRFHLNTFDPEEVRNFSLELPQKTESTINGKIYLLNK